MNNDEKLFVWMKYYKEGQLAALDWVKEWLREGHNKVVVTSSDTEMYVELLGASQWAFGSGADICAALQNAYDRMKGRK